MMVVASVNDARMLARRRLPKIFFDYIDGGAFGEKTARANIEDYDQWLLNQRVLVDVAKRDLSTTFLGEKRPSPIILGPVGFSGLFAPHGEVLAARAAHAAGIPFCLSNFGIVSLEDLRRSTPGPLWFQLYVHKNRALAEAFIGRAEQAGCEVLCVTVDTSIGGVRERDNRNGFRNTTGITPRIALDLVRRPGWCARMATAGYPRIGNLSGRPEYGGNVLQQASLLGGQIDSSFDWTSMAEIRERWKAKLVIKGILCAEDACRAVDTGADGIVVSNHGGRQLDCCPSTISVLPEIVTAVGDKTDVLIDGGVRRGAHIVKALALGAKGILLGRAYAYGLAAAGQDGVAHIIQMLATEIDVTIGHMGIPTIAELRRVGRALLRPRSSLVPQANAMANPSRDSLALHGAVQPSWTERGKDETRTNAGVSA